MSDTVTLNVAAETKARIEELASEMNRPADEVVAEALEDYIEVYRGFDRMIHERIREADAGNFASDAEVEAFFAEHASAE